MIVDDEKIKCDYDSDFNWYMFDEVRVPISRYSPIGYKLGKDESIDITPANCEDALLKILFFNQCNYFIVHEYSGRYGTTEGDITWEVNALRVLRDEMLLRGINPRTTSGKARYAIKGLTI